MEQLQTLAVSVSGPLVESFRDAAAKNNVAIALTFLEKHVTGFRNTVALIDGTGEVIATYAKVHITSFGAEHALTPGDEFVVSELTTTRGGVNVGLMICYDREFPETARILALRGAEVIITPNACHLEESRISQFRTRAFENMVGVAMANYARDRELGAWPTTGHGAMNGQSIAFSPVAFDDNDEPVDTLLVKGDGMEGLLIADFDLDAMRRYREHALWGSKFRRPERYTELVAGSGTDA
jgi:predicted amidohydrolase